MRLKWWMTKCVYVMVMHVYYQHLSLKKKTWDSFKWEANTENQRIFLNTQNINSWKFNWNNFFPTLTCYTVFHLLIAFHIWVSWSTAHVLCPDIWAASSEFVSLSIPSWQVLTAHAQPFREARDVAFCLKVPLDSMLVWASSGGSGETARMRRLAWTFAARIGDKYQIRLTRSIWVSWSTAHVLCPDILYYLTNRNKFRTEKKISQHLEYNCLHS